MAPIRSTFTCATIKTFSVTLSVFSAISKKIGRASERKDSSFAFVFLLISISKILAKFLKILVRNSRNFIGFLNFKGYNKKF